MQLRLKATDHTQRNAQPATCTSLTSRLKRVRGVENVQTHEQSLYNALHGHIQIYGSGTWHMGYLERIKDNMQRGMQK